MQEAWLPAWDFNDVATQGEKKGGAPVNPRRCDVFCARMDACRLLDLRACRSVTPGEGHFTMGSAFFSALVEHCATICGEFPFPRP